MFVEGGTARAALGLPPLASTGPAELLDRVARVLACTPEEFDVPGPPVNPRTHYVGPILEPEPAVAAHPAAAAADDPDPLVLISFSSTTMWQERALPPVIDAVATLPVRGLLTLGGVRVGALPVAPNVTAHQYLPHSEVLGRTAAVVSHGGLSTVMAALGHGVPMVCIPQGRDQGVNAERVRGCGVGVSLPTDASSEAISDAVKEVLDNPSYLEAARSMQRIIGEGGGRAAVEHVAGVIPA